MEPDTIEWFTEAIRALPSDEPVARGTPGYNTYTTQKDHWLGWLNPKSGTGTYPRSDSPGRDARYVYNHIVEPKMLAWLISASGIDGERVLAVIGIAEGDGAMPTKASAIRRLVPYPDVASALRAR